MDSKLKFFGVVVMSVLLGACSNNIELERKVSNLTNQVSDLSNKVNGLESEHTNMMADTAVATTSAKAAASEARRANARIDNIAESYKK